MKLQTFRDRMQSDLDFAVSYIIGNNPEAVGENLRGLGYSVSNVDDVWKELNEMLAEGKVDEFRRVLNVPMITDGVDAAQSAVVLQVGQGMAQMADPKGVLRTKSAVNPQGGVGSTPYGPELPGSGADDDGGGGSNWAVDFSNVFGALVNGYTAIMGANTPTSVNQTSTGTDAGMAKQQEEERKAKQNRNILIGVGIAVVVLIALFIWKPWKS